MKKSNKKAVRRGLGNPDSFYMKHPYVTWFLATSLISTTAALVCSIFIKKK